MLCRSSIRSWFKKLARNGQRFNPIVTAILMLLILPLAGCGDSGETTIQQALESAQAASTSEEISSFHFTLELIQAAEGMEETSSSVSEGYLLFPDRSRIFTPNSFGTGLSEVITIGRKMYRRDNEESPWRAMESPDNPPGLAAWELSSYLDVFISAAVEEVRELPSESIDGVECWRYRVDHNRTLDSALEQLEEATDLETIESLRAWVESIRRAELAEWAEVWIGKDDYLVRQSRNVQERTSDGEYEFGFPNVVIPEGTRFAITATFTFSGFNEPVEIEAPIITPAP